MTDRSDSSADDSPAIAEIRRLLAESRPDEPMPDDVAARMDRVLAGLSGAPAPAPVEPVAPRGAEVVPIAADRRRRAAGLLVAAAAIVVGGVALAQNLPSPGSSGGPETSAAEDRSQAEGDPNLDSGGSEHSPGEPSTPSMDQLSKALLRHGRVVVRPRRFSDDALRGRRLLDLPFARAEDTGRACADLAGRARVVPAEYRHAPAALVFRRPEGSTQVVDLFVCGTSEPVRSTTLPAP